MIRRYYCLLWFISPCEKQWKTSRATVGSLQKNSCPVMSLVRMIRNDLLTVQPVVATVSGGAFFRIQIIRYSYSVSCKLHHWHNEDYRFGSNYFYDLIIGR